MTVPKSCCPNNTQRKQQAESKLEQSCAAGLRCVTSCVHAMLPLVCLQPLPEAEKAELLEGMSSEGLRCADVPSSQQRIHLCHVWFM